MRTTILTTALVGTSAVMSTAVAANGAERMPLEEIIVTASKREAASIQDVPYNISAVSGAALEKTGADDLGDIARLIPGLSVVDAGVSNKQIVIRGLAALAGAEQVSVYFDEIPASAVNGTQTDLQPYDVERIEVLRGPQGTLYGAGSQAGTVRYIMNKPRADAFDASVGAGFGTRARDGGQRTQLNAMVNVPVIEDTFAIRAVGYHRSTDGFVDLPDLHDGGVDDERTYGGRILGQLTLGENSTLSAAAYLQDVKVDDQSLVAVGGDYRSGFVRTPFDDRLEMYNLTFEHRWAVGTLTATSSLFKRHVFYSLDVSQFTRIPARVGQPSDTDAYSSEVRFASSFAGPVQFVGGLFVQDRKRQSESYGAFIDASTGELPADELRFFDARGEVRLSNDALFGEVSYDVTERLQLTTGVRAFKLKRTAQNTLLVDFFGLPTGRGPKRESKSDDVVYKFRASYDVTDDSLVYLTYSEGFREGGENDTALGADIPASFDPDFVANHELGWKSEVLDRQLVLNGAVYFMRWQDVQVEDVDATGAFDYVSNAGEADLYGVELEGSIRPTALPGFTATFGVRNSEQKLTQDNPNSGANDPYAGKKGERIPNTFRWQASAGIEQRFDLGRWPAYARIDASYTGKARTKFSPSDPRAREWGDFILTNLQLGLDLDSWSVALYAQNIANERAAVSWTVQDVPGLEDLIQTTQPREIGVRFNWHW